MLSVERSATDALREYAERALETVDERTASASERLRGVLAGEAPRRLSRPAHTRAELEAMLDPRPGSRISADPHSIAGHLLAAIAAARRGLEALEAGDGEQAAALALAAQEAHGIGFHEWHVSQRHARRARAARSKQGHTGGKGLQEATAAADEALLEQGRVQLAAWADLRVRGYPREAPAPRKEREELAKLLQERGLDPRRRSQDTIYRRLKPLFVSKA